MAAISRHLQFLPNENEQSPCRETTESCGAAGQDETCDWPEKGGREEQLATLWSLVGGERGWA